MLGLLPTTLNVNGIEREIRPDYRNILQIISALNDDDLRDGEKVYVCLRRLYADFPSIPKDDYAAAYDEAAAFIECRKSSDKPGPKVIDWEQDEQLIFAAVNKVAGMEVRALDHLHWWTFLGYFQSIDRDDILGFILTIRQKKAKHKKLEKYETEFFNANRSLCEMPSNNKSRKQDAQEYLAALFDELSMEGGAT